MKLGQKEMASKIGVGARTYQNYERGEREISLGALMGLKHKLGIDPSWILEGEGAGPENAAPDLDVNTLVLVLEETEKQLQARHQTLTPFCKAKVADLAYRHCRNTATPDPSFIGRAIDLATLSEQASPSPAG